MALLSTATAGKLKVIEWLLTHGPSLNEKNEEDKNAQDLIHGEENKKWLSVQYN